jgi:hypothetical protein
MLRSVGDRHVGLSREIFHRPLSLGQEIDEFKTSSAGQGLADAGKLTEYLVLEQPLAYGIH